MANSQASKQITIPFPKEGLPYFASLPFYLWGYSNYDSDGDCKTPKDKEWSYLSVRNRENSDHFDIQIDESRTTLTVQGDEKSVNKIQEFFSDNPDAVSMKRVNVVNYCFEHPAVQKFNDNSFWGSWKWVGVEASELTYVGRWLMMDAMRHSNKGAWVAVSWCKETMFEQQAKTLIEHIKDVCRADELGNLVEPDQSDWENELIAYYNTILEKFECQNDPLMVLDQQKDSGDNNSDSDSSGSESEDILADRWALYGIDIRSKEAISKFEDLGFNVLPPDYSKKFCSFKITGENHSAQASYKCHTCFPNDFSASVCEYCIDMCKKADHNISQVKYCPGFCDKKYGLD
ncbi:hypothetical protein QKU48_gp0991 [Fadolivirus algeromassiliense]|jgi:hypothetical protein|uniref:Uncharacterized protein n=1 Tax=Fadolivirus FV1/VV64 TaxID=3070911 RepID=A0A7D3UVX1_9VIRU|nr:hypothetical protein QKU48_gp0991 [Fadolivirus algeromassiliense]QKF94449.1 hypothetical protein Fadolivirus_1_991 [Fadolivirus FV1/VV64]